MKECGKPHSRNGSPQPASGRSCVSAGRLLSAFFVLHSAFALGLLGPRALFAAATNPLGPDEIPPLRPPHGELPPAFWEQHGVWVLLGGALLLAVIGVVAWRLLQPKPPAVVPPEARARETLEALRPQPEDGLLLSRVSRVLRQYVAAAFELPPGELTTAEFCRATAGNAAVGPELGAALGEFLRQCDQRKFAPPAPAQPLGAVGRALQLVEQGEARRAELRRAAEARAAADRGEATTA